jgi:hypothetical protein
MIVIYLTLACLLLGVIAFIVLIAIGVGTGDRGDLTGPPRNHIDAMTRRVVGHYSNARDWNR